MAAVEKRRMCPHCRAFITTSDRVCPYCEARLEAPRRDRPTSRDSGGILGGFVPHARFTTTIILTINFGLYAATALYSIRMGWGSVMDLDMQTLSNFGAKRSDAILMFGQWWRLVTAGFLHGGLFHLLMNTWALFDLGAQVEEFYGSRRMVVFYFVSTVTGFLASTFFTSALSMGSSAGVFGLIGAMIALGVREQSAFGSAIRGLYMRWALYGLLFGLLPFFAVDNAAHLGGLAGGFATAWLAGVPVNTRTLSERFWTAATWVCIVLTTASFVRMFVWFSVSSKALER
jgi:rhomboid protease GluP